MRLRIPDFITPYSDNFAPSSEIICADVCQRLVNAETDQVPVERYR
jgi:hypothetical protein